MAKEIRYGMVGGSLQAFIGEVHRKAIHFDPRAELVAGCFSRDAAKNAETAEAYCIDASRTYGDFKDMAEKEGAREDGIDFVVIVTPNNSHYETAKTFLLNGINVVCEKPLCFGIEEAEDLKKLAADKGLLFGVTYTYTGYTMSKVMKEMIAEGKIGRIVTVNAEYVQDWLIDEVSSSETEKQQSLSIWRTDPSQSGISNCVGDIGSHIENYVHYVTGLKIKRLLSTTNTYGHTLDLNANIIVEYENGVNGAYWCSQVAAGHLNGLVVRIFGDQGSLEWEQEHPDFLRYTPKGQPTQILSRGHGSVTAKAGSSSRIPAGHPEGLYVAFANIYKNYITALIDKKNGKDVSAADFPCAGDGLSGVRFIHAVIASSKNNSVWMDV